jgi:predicted metalloendopeptidase
MLMRLGIYSVSANLGEILGRYFVQRKFPGKSKTIAQQMLSNISAALRRGTKCQSNLIQSTPSNGVPC